MDLRGSSAPQRLSLEAKLSIRGKSDQKSYGIEKGKSKYIAKWKATPPKKRKERPTQKEESRAHYQNRTGDLIMNLDIQFFLNWNTSDTLYH